jgi:hypothetical protein
MITNVNLLRLLGATVAPAHASVNHLASPRVGAVIGAVEREVPQGSEFGFDPVQP